jgi:pimeloyl-ACP methyl ester carboxylesterase
VPVVVLHGVAFGPETMRLVAREIAPRARALVVHRRGYGKSVDRATVDVAGQVDDIVAVLDRHDIERAVVVGVSGGATITVAFAMAAPERVIAAVTHEPALGPLAPGVHGLLGVAAGALSQATHREDGAQEFARVLTGPTWRRLGADDRARVRDRAEVIAAEVPHFVAFAPTVSDLRALRKTQLITSVGSLSPAQRHDAAAILALHAGAEVASIPRVAHLVQLDAPADFARVVLRSAGELG